ncbi:thiamine phosphate synthase [Rhodanobacter sp. L36]|uniref:thiamine phosphate synthase n=1 Tax=Rhodanobacter sp. L36 TaxID=1747221 RepID=UPI0020B119C0|nr:thiamine phosphate synthase [Rhodanobacter sp. L36]
MKPFPDRGLYAITDGPRLDLLAAVAQALTGGARLLQYRDESTDTARRESEVAALKQLCETYAVPLIIDQDVALAVRMRANGVHLTAEDSVRDARAMFGPAAIIGVACRDSLDLAKTAAREGASYISFGAFFHSPTKPMAPRASIDLLRQSAALGLPRVAIGGITPDNGSSLIDAGADYLAAISSLFGAADVEATARHFARLYSTSPGTSA